MDRFDELKNCMTKEIEDNINKLKKVVQKLDSDINKTDIIDKILKIGTDIKCRDKQLKDVMLNEDSVREMLNGFFDDGRELFSLVYREIWYSDKHNMYKVGNSFKEEKYFRTQEEARDYSISLGIKEDWLSEIMDKPSYYTYFDNCLYRANSVRERNEWEQYLKEQEDNKEKGVER